MIATNSEHGWNGSVYRDSSGEWMLGRYIEATYQLPQNTLEQWAKKPCKHLDGARSIRRKKVANPLVGAVGVNSKVFVYSVSDAEEIIRNQRPNAPMIAADGRWLDRHVFEDVTGERWISAPEAKRRYGVSKSSLSRWAGELPCRYLDGRNVRSKVVERRHLGAATLFSLADVEQIYSRMPATTALPAEYRDDEGVWLTNAQMQKRLGVSAIFCIEWSKKRWKGEPALRSKLVLDLRRRVNGFHVPVYLLSDAQAIKNREKSKRKYQGRGAISDEYKSNLGNEAQRVLKMILRDGPVELHEIKQRAEECRITHTILYRAKKGLGVKSETKDGVCFWRLPGAAGKGQPKPANSNGQTHLDLSHLAHVQTVAFGTVGTVDVAKSENTNIVSGVWLTVAEAERLSGVHRGTIHRAVKAQKIKHNGKTGDELRIDSADFNLWQLERAKKPEPQERDETVKRKLAEASEDDD